MKLFNNLFKTKEELVKEELVEEARIIEIEARINELEIEMCNINIEFNQKMNELNLRVTASTSVDELLDIKNKMTLFEQECLSKITSLKEEMNSLALSEK